MVCKNLNLEINQGDRIAIIGKNGSGKSSILKLILGEEISYQGEFKKGNQLIISYVPQLTDALNGSLSDFAKDFKIDEAIFKAMLSKLEVSNKEFLQPMQNLSQGQKKKIYLAKSITQSAHLYLWDESLNFVDIPSRLQLEETILKYKPTMLFVEHDTTFTNKIATKKIILES
jgi:ABC transporter related